MQNKSRESSIGYAQILLSGAVACSACVQACELETIAEVTSAVNAYDYTQDKYIPALDRTLQSSGTVWLTESSTLIWQIQQPIQSTMVFSDAGMRQYNARGEISLVTSDPLFSELSGVFISLLQGEYSVLETRFQLELTCNEEVGDWNLSLTPAVPRFSSILTGISLTGNTMLESISYEEFRGDRTTLSLSISEAPLDSDYLE